MITYIKQFNTSCGPKINDINKIKQLNKVEPLAIFEIHPD